MFTMLIFFIVPILLTFLLFWNVRKPPNFPPGPSSWPLIGGLHHLDREDPFESSLRLSDEYGPVVGIDLASQRAILINDYKIMKEALENPALGSRPNMGGFQSNFRRKNKQVAGLSHSEGPVYEQNLEFVLETLKQFQVQNKKMDAAMLKQCLEIFNFFNSKQYEIISSVKFFNFHSAKIVWTLISRRCIPDDKKIQESIDTFDLIKEDVGVTKTVMLLGWSTKLVRFWNKWWRYKENQKKFASIFYDCIEEHRKKLCSSELQRDVIDQYLNKITEIQEQNSIFHKEFGEFNLSALLSDLMMVGIDCVGQTLAWCFVILINMTEIQGKIQEEIDKVKGEQGLFADGAITLAHKSRLAYVEAFLMEVMRFRPLLPWGLPHRALTDTKVGKFNIPKGTAVYFNHFALSHDPLLWPEPHKFKPERFLQNGKLKEYEWFLPFSMGTRKCPARVLAQDQLFLMLVNILAEFDITGEPFDPTPAMTYISHFILTPQPYNFVMRKRLPPDFVPEENPKSRMPNCTPAEF